MELSLHAVTLLAVLVLTRTNDQFDHRRVESIVLETARTPEINRWHESSPVVADHCLIRKKVGCELRQWRL